jgi:Flp pilus assembly protein TadG
MRVREERGQASVELLLVIPVLFFMVVAVVFFGRILYVRIALDSATYDCARSAVESLRYHRGIEQASYAGWNTLSGFYLDASDAEFRVSYTVGYGRWYRGTEVTCHAQFNVRVDDLPFVGALYPGRAIPLHSTTTLQVERYASYWSW